MTNTVDGEAIRQLRTANGWNLRDLARHADVDPGYLSRIERGVPGTKGGGKTYAPPKVSPAVTGRIAAALDVPIAALTDPKVFEAEYTKATRRPPRIPQPREAVA